MAPNTPRDYRNLVIYEIYTRNYGPTGTFRDVEADLGRIRALGVDVVWLMPIHPIGEARRKGTLGSPYAIRDYRAVNPEYGTLQDFTRLVEKAHGLGLKVMIDVVYNHTAPDSVLAAEHPDWYFRDENGVPTSTADWSDTIDLKYPNPDLEQYLIESLVYWARQGVDGFRCDVASLVPVSFWLRAREAVEMVKPGVIWLAESVHAAFLEYRRSLGMRGASDGELYAAFDLTYEYDIYPAFQQAVRGAFPPRRYLEMLRYQDAMYPTNYIKLRYAENHDQPRIFALAPSAAQALAWTAFSAFNKGAFLIYNGQEAGARHTPSLFERDPIDWKETPLSDFLTALARIKKDPIAADGQFVILADDPIVAGWFRTGETLLGVFNTQGAAGDLAVPLADGEYTEQIGGGRVSVRGGRVAIPGSAAILRGSFTGQAQPFHSPLLDFYPQPE